MNQFFEFSEDTVSRLEDAIQITIETKDLRAIRDCLERGLNTWQLGPHKEGEVIRKLLEAMK